MIDLKKQYANTAELYRIELCKLWDVRYSDTYWIGGDVGGVLDVDCDITLAMNDIRYIVDNKVEKKVACEWMAYNLAVESLKSYLYRINLDSWLRGCPRVDAVKWDEEMWCVKKDYYTASGTGGHTTEKYQYPIDKE